MKTLKAEIDANEWVDSNWEAEVSVLYTGGH